jgi:proteic killer suppression protein
VGKIPIEIQRLALRKLRILNNAANLNDLRVPPDNQLRRLLGKRAGQYGIHIAGHWRLCFEWNNGQAFNVEIVEYRRN